MGSDVLKYCRSVLWAQVGGERLVVEKQAQGVGASLAEPEPERLEPDQTWTYMDMGHRTDLTGMLGP